MPAAGEIDVNSVFSLRSSDSGATWRDTTVVRRSGSTPAMRVSVIPAGERIHMIWLQDRTGDSYPEAILHSMSTDAVSWSDARVVVDNSPGIQSFRVAADRLGRLHLVYQHSAAVFPPQEPMRALYVQWTGSNWSLPVQLFDWRRVGQVIAIAVSPLDSLHLAANVQDFGSESDVYVASAFVGDAGR